MRRPPALAPRPSVQRLGAEAPDPTAAVRVLVLAEVPDLPPDLAELAEGVGAGRQLVDAVLVAGHAGAPIWRTLLPRLMDAAWFALRGPRDDAAPLPAPVQLLHGHIGTCRGLTLAGFGGVPRYKAVGHHQFDEDHAARVFDALPGADLLALHAPPPCAGRGMGFRAAQQYINQHRPAVVVSAAQTPYEVLLGGGTRVLGVQGWTVLEFPLGRCR